MRTNQLRDAVSLRDELEEIDLNLVRLDLAEAAPTEQRVGIRVNPSGVNHTMRFDAQFGTWLRSRILAQRTDIINQLTVLGVVDP